MKMRVTAMLTRPEPSPSPFVALFFALATTAGVSAVSALLMMGF